MTTETLLRTSTLLFPYYCLICGKPLKASRLCLRCIPTPITMTGRCSCCYTTAIELGTEGRCNLCSLIPTPFQRFRFIWDYKGQAQSLISVMKYRPSQALSRIAAEILAGFTTTLFDGNCDWEIIVPMPPSTTAIRSRLFNPCSELANAIKRLLGVPTSHFAIHHLDSRAIQASLPHRQRLSNVKNSFVANARAVMGRKVLLIDDVVTTGATSTVASKALFDVGAVSVDLLALARSQTWNNHRAMIYTELR